MQLRPNKTLINATITEVLEGGNFLKIVILNMPDQEVLPAFLWVGRSLQAKNLSSNFDLKEKDIVSVEIEVAGDPFKQSFLLHKATKIADAENSNMP